MHRAIFVPMQPAFVLVSAFGVLGAIVGSFTAALAIRWPRGESVIAGRSRCDSCGAALRWTELVPVLSFAVQRGRCRRCGAAIDRGHIVVELLSIAIGVSAAIVAPWPLSAAGALFGWLLLAPAAIDARAFWLPDRLTALLATAVVVPIMLDAPPGWQDRAIGGAIGFALLWVVAAGYRWWRGREGLGGGDPKLFGAIGLWLGWRMLPAVLVVACLFGFAWLALSWAAGKDVARETRLPFGTLLAAAAYPAWLAMISVAS